MAYKITSVNLREEDIDYLKSKEIERSSFLRQAIQAYKDGKFEFNKL